MLNLFSLDKSKQEPGSGGKRPNPSKVTPAQIRVTKGIFIIENLKLKAYLNNSFFFQIDVNDLELPKTFLVINNSN